MANRNVIAYADDFVDEERMSMQGHEQGVRLQLSSLSVNPSTTPPLPS